MKPVIRYQSQLLYRRSYKPVRTVRFKFAPKVSFTFRSFKFAPKRRTT
ncbi:MAG: hypothetical protein ACXWBP_12555 [Limisphaerales bacterium]